MIKLEEVNGKNYKRILKELDISKFPSLPQYLKDIKIKLEKKKKLSVSEEALSKAKLIKYFKEFKFELNNLQLLDFDWNTFNHRPPKDFQKIGIEFLIRNDGAILADDMGLGKTIQAIMATKILPEEYNILIVTLKTLKYNFANEINFFDNKISIIEDKWLPTKYTIIHYDSVKKWKKEIINHKFDVVICDEAHKLKYAQSKRTEHFMEVFDKNKNDIKKRWLLTGTPIDNRPAEYFNLLKIIKHPIAKDWVAYVKRFCDGYQDIYGRWNVKGSSNLSELYEETKGSILRRLKTDIPDLDLPNKYRKPVFYEMINKTAYKKSLQDFINNKFDWMDDEKPSNKELNAVVKISIWRQYCALQKIKDGITLELIENEIDNGNKVIVFSNYTKVLNELHKSLGNKLSIILDGRVKPEERFTIVDQFNTSSTLQVMLCNYKVGSVGLNIQSANIIIMNDMSYIPSDMLQAEDRAFRIGQTRDVECYYPIYHDTVEESIFETIGEKMNIITQTLDGEKKDYFDIENKEKEFKITKEELLAQIYEGIDKINLRKY